MPTQEIDALNSQAHQLEMSWWLNHVVFSFNWWIITIFNVVFFALLLMLADRKRTLKIALAFMMAFVIVGFFDEIGKYFRWWSYPYEFLQFSARFNAVNFFAVPSMFALIYQWFTRWPTFLAADVVLSLANAYIGEPIFVMLGIYKLNTWTYTRSFLVLIVIGVLIKILTDFIVRGKRQMNTEREVELNWFRRKQKIS